MFDAGEEALDVIVAPCECLQIVCVVALESVKVIEGLNCGFSVEGIAVNYSGNVTDELSQCSVQLRELCFVEGDDWSCVCEVLFPLWKDVTAWKRSFLLNAPFVSFSKCGREF